MNGPALYPVQSSMLDAVGYNDSVWVLTVKFKTGLTLSYQQVPPEVYEEMMSAKSQGQFYNANIKGKYQALSEEEPGAVLESPQSLQRPATELATVPPRVLEALPVPTTAAEASALLVDQQGLVAATIAQAKTVADDMLSIRVNDVKTYASAGEKLKYLVSVRDRAFKFLDPIRELLLKPYKTAQIRVSEACLPLDTAIDHVKKQRMIWWDEQERIRKAKENELRLQQEAKLEEERKAVGQQMTWNELDDALAKGDTAKAEALVETPIEVPATYVPPPRVESVAPKEAGISRRSNWKGEVTDFEALVLDVAEGIKLRRETGGVGGHAGVNFLQPDLSVINQVCKAHREHTLYPGIKAYDAKTEAVRREK